MNPMAGPSVDRETTRSASLLALQLQAEERLRRSSYLALQDVSCSASDGVLYLHGLLPSYYLKQVAQEITAGLEGVRGVVNRIEVLRPAADRRSRPESLAGEWG
jgi:osmotically-inducible protein OsmY